jgi:hypothetical protein
MKLINCHDCGNPVSLSARWCPRCGSKELAGPVRVRRRTSRTVGAEDRNDRTLIWMIMTLGAVGAFYGIETGSSWIRETIGALLYGLVGILAAIPIAFTINITRSRR